MTDSSYHEAGHAVSAFAYKVPITYVSIREREDSSGRNRFGEFDIDSLDDLGAAVIKISGELAARMAAGETSPTFNWFAENDDAVDARHFIARAGDDELGNRQLATLKAYALLRVRWEAVEELAAKLQRHTTVLGEDVSKICLAEAARRDARKVAAEPPKPPRPDRVPKKNPRRPSSGDREVRPFTFQVKKGAQ